MSPKEAYVEKMEAQVKQMEAKIDELRAEAQAADVRRNPVSTRPESTVSGRALE